MPQVLFSEAGGSRGSRLVNSVPYPVIPNYNINDEEAETRVKWRATGVDKISDDNDKRNINCIRDINEEEEISKKKKQKLLVRTEKN